MAESGGAASSSAAAGAHNNPQPPSPLDGGAFLLHLLQNPPQTFSSPQPQPDPHHHHFDPAVKAIGPGHPVFHHDIFNPHHQSPSPPSHLPLAHFGDPQHLLHSLPLHVPQPFPPGLWPQAPPGFSPLGMDGPAFDHQIFHLEHQRSGAAAGAGGMVHAASAERTDLPGSLPKQGYGDKGIGDHVAVAPHWNQHVARNQGERSFLRAPPGFRQPPVGRGTEYDRGSMRLGGQESRSNRLNPLADKSTASLGQSNSSRGDRGRGAASSPWQRKVAEPGKQYTQARGQSSSGHWANTAERGDGRPSQDNDQTYKKSNVDGVLHIGDVAKKGILFGQMEINEPQVGFGPPPEHFDEESEHDSQDDAVDEEDLSIVERREALNGDEYNISVEQSTSRELDELCKETVSSLKLTVKKEGKSVVISKKPSRDKDFRCDLSRGRYVSSMRVRIQRRTIQCRYDIEAFSPKFLSIFESLIPAEEEKAKQKQLLLLLEKLINKEWPNARVYLYGSCANSFGVSKSDIDVCLSIDDKDIGKIDILLKLAEILESGNLQNVQALTRARVPIVKLMDPVTGLSCDICINNLLAVVNTRLLKDYAQIDHRLRQLAFIVKHWAKSRRVNETYQGTLSSYAYVLMCIHFLQLRRPAVLPCLQAMEATFAVTVDNTWCAYFDQVERLQAFSSRNNESIARLLWGFFSYWAYRHDYTNDVISVRTGSIISKHAKDWTRRIGNDRHLICIEDPFEISHDLGRVVDKHSIKILREEFERAANILQYDLNPSVTLFEPYIRPSPEELVQ